MAALSNGQVIHLHAWTTIDGGISLSRSTSTVKSGSSSAAVNVTTGSQSNTDLLQQVTVEAGKTYTTFRLIFTIPKVKLRPACMSTATKAIQIRRKRTNGKQSAIATQQAASKTINVLVCVFTM